MKGKNLLSVVVLAIFVSVLPGCSQFSNNPVFRKSLDLSDVQRRVVKGKTTMGELEQMYGAPYTKGLLSNGKQYWEYTSMSWGGDSQVFHFVFDKNSRVLSYASGDPTGQPFQR